MTKQISPLQQLHDIHTSSDARQWLIKNDSENADHWRTAEVKEWLIDEVWNYVRVMGWDGED